jgi:uncharacterized protein (TIGR02058 family)
MPRVRCITEMGMGVDVHGRDATKAAKRAVSDAIRHSSLGFVRMVGKTAHDMFVDVTIGVPNPEAVDTSAVAKELPYGTVTVTAVKGGLEIPAESGGDGDHHRQRGGDRQSRRREMSRCPLSGRFCTAWGCQSSSLNH